MSYLGRYTISSMFSPFNARESWVRKTLLAILVVSAILRIGWIARGDTVNDEVFLGFRAVGLLDFDEAGKQTTPIEWWDPAPPWWTRLSFHDHPPLVFLIQHLSITVFGENTVGLRLPSALFGVASVYLVFLLGVLLYSPRAGLIAAGLLSVTLNHVYISRVGMQESFVIFFLLLSSYLFLRAVHADHSFVLAGVAVGLALLTKYNAVVLVPLFGVYLLLHHRAAFKRKDLWLSVAVAALVFSPVIIYNIMLYHAVGHFDFQFSYVFGQNPAVWPEAPGKETGTLLERAGDFFPRLVSSHSWLFLLLAAISLVFLRNAFVVTALASLLLLIAVIGPAYRFLTMLTPFLALSIGNWLAPIAEKKKLLLVFLSAVALFEIVYSVNNQIAHYPKGPTPWLSSKVRYENYNWGNNELGEFFKKEFARKVPAATFEMRYSFIERAQDASIVRGTRKGYASYPALIITHGNFDRGAKLWVLDRLQIYHGWPIVDLETYFDYLKERGADYYAREGFRTYYFVVSTNIVPSPEFVPLVRGIEPVSIKNPRGDEVFLIYRLERRPGGARTLSRSSQALSQD